MFTVNDLKEVKIEQALAELGLLGPLSIDGNTLPALTVQIGQFIPGNLSSSERCIAILVSGRGNNGTSELYDDLNFNLVICGIADRGDAVTVKMIANAFEESILNAKPDCPIMEFIPSGVNGPFSEGQGRIIYEVNGRVLFNKF